MIRPGPGLAVALLWAATAAADSTLAWKRTWAGPGNRDDVAEAVAVDAAGNAWVAGWTFRNDLGESVNAIVQKWSADGTLLWTRTHNGYPDAVDAAFGIAVDAYGNGYVCGSVSVTGGTSDGWVRKLAPDGADIWTLTYDSPAADQDVFRAIAVDPASGTVYVTGCERRPDLFREGNALVAAISAAGTLLWATSYDAAGRWDEALGVAVAPGGDVLVAGYATIADPATRIDANLFGRLEVLIDKADNQVNTEICVRRYGPAGGFQWERQFGADFGANVTQDWARGVLADAGGVYVAGTIDNPPTDTFARWVRKYTPDGLASLWTRVLGGTTDNNPLDLSGTPAWYGAGRLLLPGGSSYSDLDLGQDMTLEQLDPGSGALLRSDAQGSGLLINDRATAVAALPGGGIILVGWENRSDLTERKNLVVLRYDDPAAAQAVLAAPTVWPNPFDPGTAVGGVAKFGGLAPGATIRIWTPAGRLVRELATAGTGAAWDGRTGDGRDAKSGLYWYLIEAAGAPAVKGSLLLVRRR